MSDLGALLRASPVNVVSFRLFPIRLVHSTAFAPDPLMGPGRTVWTPHPCLRKRNGETQGRGRKVTPVAAWWWSGAHTRQARRGCATEGHEVGEMVLYTVVYQIVLIMSSFTISGFYFHLFTTRV